ncbi:PREDICTED: hepatic triacylglycerol lipase [Nanorana parkeri]|uniref:hepatic triacylglycerol lipase n=1 Tax=Nanorana parkeri TaxID=125878 RepID=UPI0008548079|nr:PREDICTED: hepatic triacylglycerol lipase [Nanorana parkeri]
MALLASLQHKARFHEMRCSVVSFGRSDNINEKNQLHYNQLKSEYPAGYKNDLRRVVLSKRDPSNVQAKFMLYSEETDKANMCQIVTLQPDTLEKCAFNATLPMVIIVHGWSVDGYLEAWVPKMASAFKSSKKQINVIIADWLTSAHVHYAVAVQNTRFIGLEIAEFLEWLESSVQFPRSNVHLIGYSLGAHVSGFAGSYVNGSNKIGRITGLDPAGPLFEGMSVTDRLSPDDATLVDAIHTNTQQHIGLSVGINQPVGHYDFYPNGGNIQPGCQFKDIYSHIVEYGVLGFTQSVKCAHERSVNLFIDSIKNEDKNSVAYECRDYETFEKGMCLNCQRHGCVSLGYNLSSKILPPGRRLFLKTRAQMPYKVYHYQFKIQITNQIEDKQLNPPLTISLIGTKQEVDTIPLTIGEGVLESRTYSFLITLHNDIGDLMMIRIKWDGINNIKNLWYTIQTKIVTLPGLQVKKIRVKAGETQERVTFCSENIDNFLLLPDQEKTYVRCSSKLKRKKFQKL